jgi:hypothetical protein
VGTVCVGLAWEGGSWSRRYDLGDRGREWIKGFTALIALDRLRRWLIGAMEEEDGLRSSSSSRAPAGPAPEPSVSTESPARNPAPAAAPAADASVEQGGEPPCQLHRVWDAGDQGEGGSAREP